MKALLYLFITNLKNSIKQLVKKPSKLFAAIFFVAMMVIVLISGQQGSYESTEFRDIHELYAGLLALYIFVFVSTLTNGLQSGTTLFEMSDVNLLFPSPIPPKSILFYGLIKQIQTSLYVGFVLLFQYGWMKMTYDISVGTLILVILGYALIMFCSQLGAMTLYALTALNEKARKYCRLAIYGLCFLTAAVIVLPIAGDFSIAALVAQANSLIPRLFPVAGWLCAFVGECAEGNITSGLLFLALTIAFILIMVYILSSAKADFYEDVLAATENRKKALDSQKEGKINEVSPKKVKLGTAGIGRGRGADAFYYKHKLESRRSKSAFFDTYSLIFAIIGVVFTFFMRDEGLVPGFAFMTYMQLFSISMGRWIKELTYHYVYLAPESSFKKLLAICKENIIKNAIESVIVMTAVSIIVSASPLEAIGAIIARFGFSLLFMAGNILSERIFGMITNKVFIMTLYILTLVFIALPGIIAAVVIGTVLTFQPIFLAMLVMFVWNLLLSALITFCCRDVLDYAELNTR